MNRASLFKTLSFIIIVGLTSAAYSCPIGCATCDYYGINCYTCKSGYYYNSLLYSCDLTPSSVSSSFSSYSSSYSVSTKTKGISGAVIAVLIILPIVFIICCIAITVGLIRRRRRRNMHLALALSALNHSKSFHVADRPATNLSMNMSYDYPQPFMMNQPYQPYPMSSVHQDYEGYGMTQQLMYTDHQVSYSQPMMTADLSGGYRNNLSQNTQIPHGKHGKRRSEKQHHSGGGVHIDKGVSVY